MAYALAAVGQDAAGGAEQVLSTLDRGLTAAGHRSIVIAAGPSETAGTLVPTPEPHGPFDDEVRERARLSHARAIAEALASHPVDVVHLHGIDFLGYLPEPGVPVLVTLHLPPSWYPPETFRLERPETLLACVSESQRRACPPEAANLWGVVPNGVELDVFRPLRSHLRGGRGFVLVLGRVCPEKGLHLALDAARLAGVPLLLAGEVRPYPEHERYFAEEIVPRLDAERRFVGRLARSRKRRLLAAARCVVIPSLVAETSSLVAMEALACGTPVVAFPSGALNEIVDEGRTGFFATTPEEMAEAIRAVDRIDPELCRHTAEERFSALLMVERYLALYQRLAERHGAPATVEPEPVASGGAGVPEAPPR